MVPRQAELGTVSSQLHAAVRVGPVADQITQAPDPVTGGRVDLREHGFEGVTVPVNV